MAEDALRYANVASCKRLGLLFSLVARSDSLKLLSFARMLAVSCGGELVAFNFLKLSNLVIDF